MGKMLAALACVVAGVLALSGAALAADATVVVNPANLAGWTITNDGLASEVPYAFTSVSAATGAGSLQFEVAGPTATDKFFLVAPYDGTTAALESFSYQYMVTTSSTVDTQNLYANVYVDSSANGVGAFATWYDCRFDLVPPAGESAGDWHTAAFGPTSTFTNVAKPLGSCPDTLGDLPAGSEVMFIVLNGGQSTASDNGLEGGFDDVVVDTTGGTTTYDFEPATTCATSTSGTTITLLADCTVTSTFTVPNGFTLDGDDHSIIADDPVAGHFVGAVVQAATGPGSVHIVDLEVTVDAGGLADACDAGADRLRGILFEGVGGSVASSSVTNLRQGATGTSGCQEGNGIEVRNTDALGNPLAGTRHQLTVTGSTITNYQKTGILATGNVQLVATSNTITGQGPVTYIASNGVQVSYGARAQLVDNAISGNDYTPKSYTACGLIIVKADGVSATKNGLKYVETDNAFAQNERDICNYGKGGSGYAPST